MDSKRVLNHQVKSEDSLIQKEERAIQELKIQVECKAKELKIQELKE